MIRSFIAFDIDNQSVVKKLEDAQNRLLEIGANLKIVQPQNIHITMRFLGNIQYDIINSIYKQMEEVNKVGNTAEIRNVKCNQGRHAPRRLA